MSIPILATKLYIPPLRSKGVPRRRLLDRMDAGFDRKLTLLSAPAGFGKTTLVSEWISNTPRPTAWLSLDSWDNDPSRFLTYLISALQKIVPGLGEALLGSLQALQPPPIETTLTLLLNEISAIGEAFVLVLDDYHAIENTLVDNALAFLLDYLPPQMHLVITTREDPPLPLARLRVQNAMTELRAADLRFTVEEAAQFLNQVMGLQLAPSDIAALEARTEGWIAGLQLAALSIQGQQEPAAFITAFTGSHHFVLDYLLVEVLQRQPEPVQHFLLRTSMLDRLCGPLCDAILESVPGSGQTTLEYLDRANLFIIPLDSERRWYRYHYLFGDLLRQRNTVDLHHAENAISEYHRRASVWFEANDLTIDAFRHAAAAQDIDRAEHLIDSGKLPMHFHSVVADVNAWLESIPVATRDARPTLWLKGAAMLLVAGQTAGVEESLRSAEAVLHTVESEPVRRAMIGQIAAARATVAMTQYQVEAMFLQSRRALEYLPPENQTHRGTALCTLAFAYQSSGDRVAAEQTYTEAITLNQSSGNIFFTIWAMLGLGQIQEFNNQLGLAAETYQRALVLFGEHPQPTASEAHLGLARIYYEWNDLEAAVFHGEKSLELARQYDRRIDRFLLCEIFLARLKLAQGDATTATAILADAERSTQQSHFAHRCAEVAAAQVSVLLRRGNSNAAAQLARTHALPLAQAQVCLAQDDPAGALAILEPLRQQMTARRWIDEQIKVLVLESIARWATNDRRGSVQRLTEALTLAAPGKGLRTFLDEKTAIAPILAEITGINPDYLDGLRSALESESRMLHKAPPSTFSTHLLLEALSQRELEVLQLIAQGLSNQAISQRLYLALSTVKGHNQRIFDKLRVERRTEAIARARELGLL
jgi:LuxR family maltose regulon positive regulatory protein